ncbi:MAG: HEAT repeat domain-containing protein [Micromonosporaceae bacterium]|nr:HEAT repeat domain-containing protein [Micromonosporaceae bacterium]
MIRTLLNAVVGSMATGVLLVITLLAVTALQHSWEQRRKPLIAAAGEEAAAIAAIAALGDDAPPPPRSGRLERLHPDEQITLLLALAPSLGGESLLAIRTVATDLGLIERAQRHLRSHNWARRLAAARFLTGMGLSCDALVASLFRDPHPALRVQAAIWASSCFGPAPIDRVVALLLDPDGYCRFAAKDTLVRIGVPAIPALGRLLEATDEATVTAGLEVATAMGDSAFVDHAVRIARSGTAYQRALAASILGGCGGHATASVLRELLHDPEAAVRQAAVTAIAEQGDWPAAANVADLMDDRVWAVRREAGLALLKLGAPGVILLREASAGAGEAASIATQVMELRTLHAAGSAP